MIDGIYIRVAIVGLLLGVGTFGGCRWQKAVDRPVIERKDEALRKAARDLGNAAAAMRGFAVRFQQIDAIAGENVAAAAAAKQRAEQAAQAALLDKLAAQQRVHGLERELLAERDSCIDGRRPICGIPLR